MGSNRGDGIDPLVLQLEAILWCQKKHSGANEVVPNSVYQDIPKYANLRMENEYRVVRKQGNNVTHDAKREAMTERLEEREGIQGAFQVLVKREGALFGASLPPSAAVGHSTEFEKTRLLSMTSIKKERSVTVAVLS